MVTWRNSIGEARLPSPPSGESLQPDPAADHQGHEKPERQAKMEVERSAGGTWVFREHEAQGTSAVEVDPFEGSDIRWKQATVRHPAKRLAVFPTGFVVQKMLRIGRSQVLSKMHRREFLAHDRNSGTRSGDAKLHAADPDRNQPLVDA